MVNQRMLGLGTARSVIRELFEYGKQRAAVVGAEMTLSAAMKGTKMNVSMTVAGSEDQGADLPQVDISMNLTMDGAYQATSQKPETEPPAGAPVSDLMEMFSAQGTADSVPAA